MIVAWMKYGALLTLALSVWAGSATGSGGPVKPQTGVVPASSSAVSPAPQSEQVSPVPVRIGDQTVPAQIAFTSDGLLYVMDASKRGAQPVAVTKKGGAGILGWSHDGKWLLYRYSDSKEWYETGQTLWAVRADGSGAVQVDDRPIESAFWSPVANTVAYVTERDQSHNSEARLAEVAEDGRVTVRPLLPASEEVADLAWSPDGKSLAVSLPRSPRHPTQIDRVTPDGKRTLLWTTGEPLGAGQTDDLYIWAAVGLTWSPDGKRLVYYLHPNSGSLTADGVGIQLLDVNTGKTTDIGEGLTYRQWLAWSPDSARLAFVRGGPREATTNKQLAFAEAGGRVVPAGKPGFVDTQPVWTRLQPYDLLFVRGKDTTAWEGKPQAGVLVPGQRVWMRTADGEQRLVTTGPEETADYYPQLSADGSTLLFLRLTAYDKGSLYLQPYPAGEAREWVRGLIGTPGYYGNYYPAWVEVYWKK